MNIVLLGATGFVGSALIRRLRTQTEHSVTAFVHRKPLTAAAPHIRCVAGSLTSPPTDLLPEQPHVIVHCASKQIDHDGSGFACNPLGVEALTRQCNAYTRGILFASSFSVYGEGEQADIDEQAPRRPETELARSRAACEDVLAAYAAHCSIPVLALRTRYVFGTGDRYFLPGLLRLLQARLGVGNGSQRFTVIDVDDYAKVLLGLVDAIGQGRIAGGFTPLNVGYAEPLSFARLADTLRGALALPPPRLSLPAQPALLGLLDRLPAARIRQFSHRLRLIGLNHYGSIKRLNALLDTSVLGHDPAARLHTAAQRLAL
ncbi:hypothetical protein CAI21_04115 [Alkalilimnicola ehrlichii]|uniref:NAD-dependent epimerase/dehydratase domain-containing protein n=1 Tax=Alkalilimnicola ehrlichii TaxID=351052 RepID=A0A3E0X1X1_9GAMM|nr:NAD(P)-dependent oxidoreductase [Alkalilimnicola ehrlichii]RFA30704.1 hypothetical protein CAI21_04115 [Alkalilimnicola ehrlichii]RFA38281.1 hypothetical protein CAL65_05480 [Alkalilimnicola ehrlichii]